MGLWDDDAETWEEDNMTNRYLRNPDEGLKLVSKVLGHSSYSEVYNQISTFERLLRQQFLEFSSSVDYHRSAAVFRDLLSIKDRLYEKGHIKLLSQKSLVAIGGGFSAGKSKFINSIIGECALPEDLRPTTSLPTYIVHGEPQLKAFTYRGHEIGLDADAVNALSHAFYDRYKFSFTQIVQCIVIQSPKQPYENLVLLDTPGYTKGDLNKRESNTDEFTAREHLKLADYLIWVMDIENGTINESDLDFIQKLEHTSRILYVFNKADKKSPEDIKSIVSEATRVINSRGLPLYNVCAFSSRDCIEFGSDSIARFFKEANESSARSKDIKKEFAALLNEYDVFFVQKGATLRKQRKELSQVIQTAPQLDNLGKLAHMYSEINSSITLNSESRTTYKKLKEKLKMQMNAVMQAMEKTA